MSRRRIIRQGSIPDPEKIIIPERACPIYMGRVKDMIDKFVVCLTQVDPPPADKVGWRAKYNAKLYYDMFLIRSPWGAGMPIPIEMLEHLTTAADWDRLARRTATWLKDEANAVSELQDKSAIWHALNPKTSEN